YVVGFRPQSAAIGEVNADLFAQGRRSLRGRALERGISRGARQLPAPQVVERGIAQRFPVLQVEAQALLRAIGASVRVYARTLGVARRGGDRADLRRA